MALENWMAIENAVLKALGFEGREVVRLELIFRVHELPRVEIVETVTRINSEGLDELVKELSKYELSRIDAPAAGGKQP